MRILLTGATGFLGRYLLPLLGTNDVLCLTRDAAVLPKQKNVVPLEADLTRADQWSGAVTRFAPEWCIHAAWQGLPDYSLAQCRANLDAGVGLLEVLGTCGLKRMTVVGSCWEYGDAVGAVSEDSPGVDCGVFAATKRALYEMTAAVARQRAFEYRWARVFFVYGPGQRAQSLIPSSHAAFKAGHQPEIRSPAVFQDFIHVEDVARALLALTSANIGSGVFNIGSGTPNTVGDIVNQVAVHDDRPTPFPGLTGQSGFWADTTKIVEATGWSPEISIADGIGRTLTALDCVH